MRNLRAWANYLVEEAGPLGVAGVSLLVFAAAYFFSTVVPLMGELSSAKAEYAATEKDAQSFGRMLQRRTDKQDRVAAFYDFFPSRAEIPSWLAIIYKAAGEAQLTLAKGEYRYQEKKDGRLESVEILLPVKGSYQKIRLFIAKVLYEVPVASFDEIDFTRKAVNEGEVEANIRFTLYVRKNG